MRKCTILGSSPCIERCSYCQFSLSAHLLCSAADPEAMLGRGARASVMEVRQEWGDTVAAGTMQRQDASSRELRRCSLQAMRKLGPWVAAAMAVGCTPVPGAEAPFTDGFATVCCRLRPLDLIRQEGIEDTPLAARRRI